VRTSHASGWNFGAGSQTCTSDAECADGVACTEDVCVNGYCALVPDHGACADADLCNGIEICDTDTGCRPGAPPLCGDDGNICTEDVCDAATGRCGITTACPDDGNPCTDPVCDPTYGCTLPVEGPCDDLDACTTGEQCQYTTCLGVLATFDEAQCELDAFLATPLCGSETLDPRILEYYAKRIVKMKKQILKASLAVDVEHANRRIISTQKLINGIVKKNARLHFKKQRISYDCFTAVNTRVGRLSQLLFTLYR
jgi:hypothetical protein